MKRLFLIPSFYGLLFFSSFYALYRCRLFSYTPLNPEASFIFILAIAGFLLATVLAYFSYGAKENNDADTDDKKRIYVGMIYVFLIIGLIGYLKYFRDSVAFFGSLLAYLEILAYSSYQIRHAAEDIGSFSIQLTYFSWIAVAIINYYVFKSVLKKKWLFVSVVVFMLNFMFIDRTRPFWLLVTGLLPILPLYIQKSNFKRLISIGVVVGVVLYLGFNSIGMWIGKISSDSNISPYGETEVPASMESAYYYGTGSYAYFNEIVERETNFDYIPYRSFFPVYKLLSSFGLTEAPPSRINDFYIVTEKNNIESNVGTFLEPFYRDGGTFYAIIGILIHSFLFNLLGMYYLRKGSAIALYGWANLCFCNIISCFTPKFVTFPFILFILIPFFLSEVKKGDS